MRFLIAILALTLVSTSSFANMTKTDLEVVITEEFDAGYGTAGNLDHYSLDYMDNFYDEAAEGRSSIEGGISIATIINYGEKLWAFIVKKPKIKTINNRVKN